MSFHFEKDLKFARKSGYQKSCSLWVNEKLGWGEGRSQGKQEVSPKLKEEEDSCSSLQHMW